MTAPARPRRAPEDRRPAVLGDKSIVLLGALPRPGDLLGPEPFAIPPARHANAPLTPASLMRGLALVSTLPNIARHACAAQILGLEEGALHRLEDFRLVHVSADEPACWREVDHFHPDLRAEGFSLHDADAESRRAFGAAFGIAVQGHHRIAHGLFALIDGLFLAADVPFDQMATPDVAAFLGRTERLLCLNHAPHVHLAPRTS
jgi:hypothetical protein